MPSNLSDDSDTMQNNLAIASDRLLQLISQHDTIN